MYSDELETYLDEFDKDSLYSLNMKLSFFFTMVMFPCFPNKGQAYKDFSMSYTFSSFCVKLIETQIMIFVQTKREFNQFLFYMADDQIQLIHEDKYLRVNLCWHG